MFFKSIYHITLFSSVLEAKWLSISSRGNCKALRRTLYAFDLIDYCSNFIVETLDN